MFKKMKNFWVAKYIINKVKTQIGQKKKNCNKVTFLMYKELLQINKKNSQQSYIKLVKEQEQVVHKKGNTNGLLASASLMIRETQTKLTAKYLFFPTFRLAKMKMFYTTLCW